MVFLKLLVVLCVPLFQDDRIPIPSNSELSKVKKEIGSALGPKPAFERLVEAADDAAGRPVLRYQLLQQVRKEAAIRGDVRTAFYAVDGLSDAYQVDQDRLARETLNRLKKAPRNPKEARVILRGLIAEAWIRADAGDPLGERIAKEGPRIAVLTRDRKLSELAVRAAREIVVAQKLAAEASDAELLLSTKDDPAARLTLGRHRCFIQGDWMFGIPHLEKSSDKVLRGLAILEQEDPKSAEAQMNLGDAWWKARKGAREFRAVYEARARRWHEKARLSARGLMKGKADKRLLEMRRQSIPLPVTDLLEIVDPSLGMDAPWTREGNALVYSRGRTPRLPISYRLPQEYDLKLTVEKIEGKGSFNLCLVADSRPFTLSIDGATGDITGVDQIDGKYSDANETTYRKKLLPFGVKHQLLVRVRDFGLQVMVNETMVVDWAADWNRVAPHPALQIEGHEGPVLASFFAIWKVTEFAISPVTGHGRIIP